MSTEKKKLTVTRKSPKAPVTGITLDSASDETSLIVDVANTPVTKKKVIVTKNKVKTDDNESVSSNDTDKTDVKEKKEKAKPVRGAKKIKTVSDVSYLRLPEKDAVIDFYDDK